MKEYSHFSGEKINFIFPRVIKCHAAVLINYEVSFTLHKRLFPVTTSVLYFCFSSIVKLQGFVQQFWEKAPGQNCDKMINLTSKLGKINNIEQNKQSKSLLVSSKSIFF